MLAQHVSMGSRLDMVMVKKAKVALTCVAQLVGHCPAK